MPETDHNNRLPLAIALRFWLWLGMVSFGGPAGQIAMMHRELVEKRRWISERRFLHALNYCMVLPGPEAQQLAAYIGWLLHGTAGGIIAGGLFVLPSLLLLIGLSWIYMAFGDLPMVAGFLDGIKPAVAAIVLFAAWRIGSRTLQNRPLQAIAAAALLACALNVPFPLIILLAALIGLAGSQIAPQYFSPAEGHVKSADDDGKAPALIDDDTPPPPHAQFNPLRTLTTAAIGLGLWLAALGGLALRFGWHGTLTQMGWFFTKAALLTFGGAYAVLPYVYQGGVETYGWLEAQQMMDGLALGETTPGPLIMVVAFVGFVGGWVKQIFGPDALALAGIAGALTVTFFTFLPSFLFILLGGPAVEASRHELRLSAPLVGVTAAVVGVILNLAGFFAVHVLWPHGFGAEFAWFSALLIAADSLALFRFKVGVIKVILCSGLAGLLPVFSTFLRT